MKQRLMNSQLFEEKCGKKLPWNEEIQWK